MTKVVRQIFKTNFWVKSGHGRSRSRNCRSWRHEEKTIFETFLKVADGAVNLLTRRHHLLTRSQPSPASRESDEREREPRDEPRRETRDVSFRGRTPASVRPSQFVQDRQIVGSWSSDRDRRIENRIVGSSDRESDRRIEIAGSSDRDCWIVRSRSTSDCFNWLNRRVAITIIFVSKLVIIMLVSPKTRQFV